MCVCVCVQGPTHALQAQSKGRFGLTEEWLFSSCLSLSLSLSHVYLCFLYSLCYKHVHALCQGSVLVSLVSGVCL